VIIPPNEGEFVFALFYSGFLAWRKLQTPGKILFTFQGAPQHAARLLCLCVRSPIAQKFTCFACGFFLFLKRLAGDCFFGLFHLVVG